MSQKTFVHSFCGICRCVRSAEVGEGLVFGGRISSKVRFWGEKRKPHSDY